MHVHLVCPVVVVVEPGRKDRRTKRLINIFKICYERDVFHGARNQMLKMIINNNNNYK